MYISHTNKLLTTLMKEILRKYRGPKTAPNCAFVKIKCFAAWT